MFTKEGLKKFHRWTHESLHLVFEHAAALPTGTITEKVPGFGYATVRDQLVHVLDTEVFWISALQKLESRTLQSRDFPTAAALLVGKRRVMDATTRYLEQLPERDLNVELEELPENWIGPSRSPSFILLQILTHAFHHKGQVVAMFRILGNPIEGDTDLQR